MTRAECELCGGRAFTLKFRGLADYLTGECFDVLTCRRCSLVRTDPLPAEDKIGDYYPPRYRGNRHSFTGAMRNRLRGRAVARRFPRRFRGRLLDVGCGNGSFALHMRRLGWDVAATEIDPAVVDRLKTAGVDARLSDRADFERPFDVVTSWHVLEHVPRPLQMAEWVKTVLKPGGIVQFTVPNADCLQARFFGRNWMHLDVPRHRHHFTPATLKDLVGRAGFQAVDLRCFALEYDWFGVVQSGLNAVSSHPNFLFDTLTKAPIDDRAGITARDRWTAYGIGPVLTAVGLPAALLPAAFGNGATLTLTATA